MEIGRFEFFSLSAFLIDQVADPKYGQDQSSEEQRLQVKALLLLSQLLIPTQLSHNEVFCR